VPTRSELSWLFADNSARTVLERGSDPSCRPSTRCPVPVSGTPASPPRPGLSCLPPPRRREEAYPRILPADWSRSELYDLPRRFAQAGLPHDRQASLSISWWAHDQVARLGGEVCGSPSRRDARMEIRPAAAWHRPRERRRRALGRTATRDAGRARPTGRPSAQGAGGSRRRRRGSRRRSPVRPTARPTAPPAGRGRRLPGVR
jgi:hypothetical protein